MTSIANDPKWQSFEVMELVKVNYRSFVGNLRLDIIIVIYNAIHIHICDTWRCPPRASTHKETSPSSFALHRACNSGAITLCLVVYNYVFWKVHWSCDPKLNQTPISLNFLDFVAPRKFCQQHSWSGDIKVNEKRESTGELFLGKIPHFYNYFI